MWQFKLSQAIHPTSFFQIREFQQKVLSLTLYLWLIIKTLHQADQMCYRQFEFVLVLQSLCNFQERLQ